MRGFEDGFGGAASEGGDLRVPFAPRGDGSLAGPFFPEVRNI